MLKIYQNTHVSIAFTCSSSLWGERGPVRVWIVSPTAAAAQDAFVLSLLFGFWLMVKMQTDEKYDLT